MCDNCNGQCRCNHNILSMELICIVDRSTNEVNEIYEAGDFKRYINDNFVPPNIYIEDINECIEEYNSVSEDEVASLNIFRAVM